MVTEGISAPAKETASGDSLFPWQQLSLPPSLSLSISFSPPFKFSLSLSLYRFLSLSLALTICLFLPLPCSLVPSHLPPSLPFPLSLSFHFSPTLKAVFVFNSFPLCLCVCCVKSQVNLDLASLLDSDDKKSKNKRGVLPKHATNIMRSWLFQHLMV